MLAVKIITASQDSGKCALSVSIAKEKCEMNHAYTCLLIYLAINLKVLTVVVAVFFPFIHQPALARRLYRRRIPRRTSYLAQDGSIRFIQASGCLRT